jgi:hypothetical protein
MEKENVSRAVYVLALFHCEDRVGWQHPNMPYGEIK